MGNSPVHTALEMLDLHEGTIEEEIEGVSMFRPHVVLLGAGASRAACPTGDANGKLLPLMADFVDVLGRNPLLMKFGVDRIVILKKFSATFMSTSEMRKLKNCRGRLRFTLGN